MIRVKQSPVPAAMFVCSADTQQRRGYWDRGARVGETSRPQTKEQFMA